MIGETFSHYRIVEVLGAGGMGAVYRAEDLRLQRQVAIKVLAADLLDEPAALEWFKREAASPRRSTTRTSARSTTSSTTRAGRSS